jgi:adenylate kinase
MKMMIIGPQGSGKGTYASRLSVIMKIPHVSTGQIFRDNIAAGTPLGKKVEDYIKSGKLVPDEITMNIVKERIGEPDCANGFIFDGFPRSKAQAEMFEKMSGLDVVIYLEVPEWLLLKRLSSRVTCSECGKIYNLLNVKPKKEGACDDCQGELTVRDDETPKAIKTRLQQYEENTKPLIDYYKKKGILKSVTCDKLETLPEEVVDKILDIIGVKK